MKNKIKYLLLTAVITVIMVPAYVFSYEDLPASKQPNGFRDVYWESSKDDHPYMFTTHGNYNGVEIYNRECDNLTLGEAKLSEIAYYYYNDEFYQVLMTLRSGDDHKLLLDELIEDYGKPEKDSEVYIWENKTVSIRLYPKGVTISYLPVLNKITHE